MSGRVVHFEIPFDDGDRARDFYQNTFGWGMIPMPEMGYTMVSTGPSGEQGPSEPGYIGGGMMQRGEPFQGPIITVDVDDIDATLAAIEERGGKTVQPPPGGWRDGLLRVLQRPRGQSHGSVAERANA